MDDDLLHALLALAVLFIPLGFAWLMVSLSTRRRARRDRQAVRKHLPLR